MTNININTPLGELDLPDGFTINLTYQISDIRDVTTRNSTYSKAFKIVGTKHNNNIFKNSFEISIGDTFNPNTKLFCDITDNGLSIMNGFLQLTKIIRNLQDVEYHLVFYSQLKDIVTAMADEKLARIDLSKYNHTYTITNVYESWFRKIEVSEGKTLPFELGRGYVYPEIKYNGNDLNRSVGSDYYPAIYVKEYLDGIFAYTGFNYKSEFFNSEKFSRLIIPYNKGAIEITPAEKRSRESTVALFPKYDYNPSFDNVQRKGYYREDSTKNIWDKVDFGYLNDPKQGIYTHPNVPDYTGVDLNGSSFDSSKAEYVCNKEGNYNVTVSFETFLSHVRDGNKEYYFEGGAFKNTYYLKYYDSTADTTTTVDSTVTSLQPSETATKTGYWYDTNGSDYISFTLNKFRMRPGDKLYVLARSEAYESGSNRIKWRYKSLGIALSCSNQVKSQLHVKANNSDLFKVEVSDNALSLGEDVFIQNLIPDMKMKDFFSSIIKMFNLLVQQDPNNPNLLLIEPYDDFFNSGGEEKDWSTLLDRSKDLEIVPMSELDFKFYNFEYAEGADYFSKQYKENNDNEVYGSYRLEIDNDFLTKEKKTKIAFGSAPVSDYNNSTDRVRYFACDIDDESNIKTVATKPKIMVFGGTKDCKRYRIAEYGDGTNGPDDAVLEFYGFAGHTDDPYLPSYDINFYSTKEKYWLSNNRTDSNLFYDYYFSSLSDILDADSKLVTGYFRLTNLDISIVDFRDVIYLDGSYFRINKILNYNPSNDDLTKVELLKLKSNKLVLGESNNGIVSKSSSFVEPCPADIKYDGRTNRYVSANGNISESCCNSLTQTNFKNGVCRKNIININPIDNIDRITWSGQDSSLYKPYSWFGSNDTNSRFSSPESFNGGLAYTNNTFIKPNNKVMGNGNYISPTADNNLIIGDKNFIGNNVRNSFAIGEGNYVTESDSFYLYGAKIDSDKLLNITDISKSDIAFVIDGGLNEVINPLKQNTDEVIDGTFNSSLNILSWTKPVILDGNLSGNSKDDIDNNFN